jgi:hypothetical protein
MNANDATQHISLGLILQLAMTDADEFSPASGEGGVQDHHQILGVTRVPH